jgi:hypothetical protein
LTALSYKKKAGSVKRFAINILTALPESHAAAEMFQGRPWKRDWPTALLFSPV